jgi:hypothetical protein
MNIALSLKIIAVLALVMATTAAIVQTEQVAAPGKGQIAQRAGMTASAAASSVQLHNR